MAIDLLAYDNIVVGIGLGLNDFFDIEGRLRKISEVRKRIFFERGLQIPVVHLEDDFSLEVYEVQVKILDKVTEKRIFDVDGEESYNDILDFICNVIYDNAEIFKGLDFETEVLKLRKDGSLESCRKLVEYYSIICGDPKMEFHYLKKAAEFNHNCDLRALESALVTGRGCKKDLMQARKVTYRRIRKRYKDDQIF